MARGVVTGHRQEHEEGGDLGVGEALAVDLRLHERRHQIIAGMLLAVRGDDSADTAPVWEATTSSTERPLV